MLHKTSSPGCPLPTFQVGIKLQHLQLIYANIAVFTAGFSLYDRFRQRYKGDLLMENMDSYGNGLSLDDTLRLEQATPHFGLIFDSLIIF